jgi:hypothetical protein
MRIMSEAIEDGGPAYPLKEPLTSDALGMSLRDHFAGLAMGGMCSEGPAPRKEELDYLATRSYQMADAMLRARATGKGE